MKYIIHDKHLDHTPLKSSLLHRRKRKRNLLAKVIWSMIIVSITLTIVLYQIGGEIKSQLEASDPSSPILSVLHFFEGVVDYYSKPTLKEVIGTVLLREKGGTYGIVVKNLKTGESYTLNADRKFQPASVYKIWVMATVYDQIEKGKFKESDTLSQSVSVLNQKFAIASDSAEMTEGVVTFTVKEALEQMITISHNYAALILTEKVGITPLQQYLTDHHLYNSRTGIPPYTTAADIALFYEKLYNGELGDKTSTEKMIALLKRQKLVYGIPKYLPDSAQVANKTGQLDEFSHDSGLVYTPKGDYIIVIMTETEDSDKAKETLALVSQAVYKYFNE